MANENNQITASDVTGKKCVLVELDYKGSYQRFALLPEEFAEAFPELWDELYRTLDNVDSDSYTIRPLVHIWYRVAKVNDVRWDTFFSDMEDGLPESDVESDNLAIVDLTECKALRCAVEETIKKVGLEDDFIRNV